VLSQDGDHAIRLVRAEGRVDETTEVKHDQLVLPRPADVEGKPVARMGRTPAAALTGQPAHGSHLRRVDLSVGDVLALAGREVVATQGDAVAVEDGPTIVVLDLTAHIADGSGPARLVWPRFGSASTKGRVTGRFGVNRGCQ